ncbi:MAG: hypothetical protein UZ06_CHB003000780 [Chlorobi bacterium OLB6]|nr:MAG: hypothetical protein UZ06_CHB003000780 [Chlorobi bacterium OLB6]
MRFVLVGGSGYLGTLLSERFTADGHQVVNISRSGQAPGLLRALPMVTFSHSAKGLLPLSIWPEAT